MEINVKNEQALRDLGVRLGGLCKGGEVIQLVGDVGAGKTTLVKAIAEGMGITENVSSPSYTLSQSYATEHADMRLVHYDFYRLNDPGVLAEELKEELADKQAIVAIEWADIVAGVLPADHLRIQIAPTDDDGRRLILAAGGKTSTAILEQLS